MRSKKRITPNEGYALPRSAEKGVPFIDFHAVLKDIIPFKPKYSRKIVKRRRKDV